MQRAEQLMAAIADPENLREAFLKAVRGKRGKTDCRAFQERLDENLTLLREELLAGRVWVGDYHLFQIKEQLGRGAYVRYMDDFVVWGGCREELKAVRDRVREFLAVELKLELKAEPSLNRTALGMDFLGYRLFPWVVRLARRSKIRFARKLRRYERAFVEGWWSEAELQQRTTALVAFVMTAESGGFRRHVLERFGVAAIGLEPRDPGRQLEQQRQELPVSEPQQQQQPVQQEQQHWVPGCLGPSSTGALTRPPSRPAQRAERRQTETASRPVRVGKRSFPKAPGGLWACEAPPRPPAFHDLTPPAGTNTGHERGNWWQRFQKGWYWHIPPTLALEFWAGYPLLNRSGMLSSNLVVQYSTNLAGSNWMNLLSLSNLPASPYLLLDPAGDGEPARFYRAFVQ